MNHIADYHRMESERLTIWPSSTYFLTDRLSLREKLNEATPHFYSHFASFNGLTNYCSMKDLIVIPFSCIMPWKKSRTSSQTHPVVLPKTGEDGLIKEKPTAILDRRMIKQDNWAAIELLIQWSNMRPKDATWEKWQTLHKGFPNCQLEYKAAS